MRHRFESIGGAKCNPLLPASLTVLLTSFPGGQRQESKYRIRNSKMPNDPFTIPVLSYLREMADDFRKQNAPIHVFEESEWVRESNGNVHKTRVERPFLGFFLDKHKKTSSLYMDAPGGSDGSGGRREFH
jgi:hypothetical protein